MSSPSSKTQKLFYSALGIVLGVGTFIATLLIMAEPEFDPFIKVCNDPTLAGSAEFSQLTNFHDYEPRFGLGVLGSFVCIMTQFLHQLVQTNPAGLLTWACTMTIALPVTVLLMVEAGRTGAYGAIRYPMIVGVLYMIFGLSVIIPLIWIPAYCFGRGKGLVSPIRARTSAVAGLPMALVSLCVFVLDTTSYAWTVSAGLLGGPVLAMIVPLLISSLDRKPPTEASISPQARHDSAHRVALSYGISGIFAIVGWFVLVFIAWNNYTSLAAFLSDIWGPTVKPAVRFMTIDAVVLYLGLLIHIAFRNGGNAAEAIFLTPLFGPGAACAIALAGVEIMEASKFKDD